MFSTIVAFLSILGVYDLLPVVAANKDISRFENDTVYIGEDSYRFRDCSIKGFVMLSYNGNSFASVSCPGHERAIELAKQCHSVEQRKGARAALRIIGLNPEEIL